MAKIELKTDYEILKMREVGKYNGQFFDEITELIKPGISTMEIENYAQKFSKKNNLHPCFMDVADYFWATCISVNEQVVHGIPSDKKILQEGDLVSVDVGFIKDGWIGDATRAYLVGEKIADNARRLYEATKESLNRAIEVAQPGNTLGDIGFAIQSYVEPLGFSVVREYVGHGVGRRLHESPTVYHFGNPGEGLQLRPGLVIAIEPMINEGVWQTETLADGWTVVTKDRKLSCQFEHTVAITTSGPRVLTI